MATSCVSASCLVDLGPFRTRTRTRTAQVFVPEHWYPVVETAWPGKPFTVLLMQQANFKDFKQISKCFTNRKKNTDGEKIIWRKIQWLRYSHAAPTLVNYRYTLNEFEPWKVMDITKRGKALQDVAPHPKYSGSLPVNPKVADLQFMPAEYHSFSEQL